MNIDLDKLRSLYSYHPLASETRRKKHEVVNSAAIDFVFNLKDVIDNPDDFQKIIEAVGMIRMMANQSITYSEEGIGFKEVFKTD